MKTNWIALVITSLAATVGSVQAVDSNLRAVEYTAEVADTKVVKVKISGMKCAHKCGNKIRAELTKLDGVVKYKVKKGKATITAKKSVTEAQILAAVKRGGFVAKVSS